MQNGTPTFDTLYQRERILGRGASGVAFVVHSKTNPQRQYVAKEICVVRTDEKRRKEAFAESQLLRTLSHENIVACYYVIQENDMMYIVMEYATGGDLSRRILRQRSENRRFCEHTVMATFVQICTALAYIHSRKVLHRDLKPANIFIVGEGELSTCTVKLGDFGISKIIESTLGQVNSTVGTPSYLSPEICRNHPYGMKADVWSLGVVLYELACLRVPFHAGNLPAMAVMICTSEPKPVPDEYGAGLADLVKDLLVKEPSQRPMVTSVLRRPFVSGFLSAGLRGFYGVDEPSTTKTVRTTSLPTCPNRAADRAADPAASRLPSCGASGLSARSRQHRSEDPNQWCWHRPGDPAGEQRPKGRNNSPHDLSRRRAGHRSDRSEQLERLPDHTTDHHEPHSKRWARSSRGHEVEDEEPEQSTMEPKGAWDMMMETVTPETSGLAESDDAPPPAELSDPLPPEAQPPAAVLSALSCVDSQPARPPRRNRRRGKPPLLACQDSSDAPELRSPTRPAEQSSASAARSVSPNRSAAPKPPEEPPGPMRSSGSAPSLPPLPPLLAPPRDRISRSRSVVTLQEPRPGHSAEAFQPLQRQPNLFRTQPLTCLEPQGSPPQPRPAAREEPQLRKLPTAVAGESRHWREPGLERLLHAAVKQGWADGSEADVRTARLSVV